MNLCDRCILGNNPGGGCANAIRTNQCPTFGTELTTPAKTEREKLIAEIYIELAAKEPPLNQFQRDRLWQFAEVNADSVLIAQSLLTAKEDREAMLGPYGGDIDLYSPQV